MTDCNVPCATGSLQAAELATMLEKTACAHGAVTISKCRVDAAGLAPLRAEGHADLRLTLSGVSGSVDLEGAQLRDVMVVESRLERLVLHDATVDRVRIAPSGASVPDPYSKDAISAARVYIETVDARSCHARTFALLAVDVVDVNFRHLRIDDALDLTWTRAGTLSLRSADVRRIEAARLVTLGQLDLFGAHATQASFARAILQSLNAETATVERALSLNDTVIVDQLDGDWFTAGAVIFTGARVGRMDLSYAHLGLLDIDSTLGFESGPIDATGLHVDSIGGDVLALTRRIDRRSDSDGAFHSIEAALRSGGRYTDANTVAFEGSRFTAGVSGKLPAGLALLVIALLGVCLLVAARCCKPVTGAKHEPWKVFLCALDIVLPSFVDIGALSAWTDYGDAGRKDAEVQITGRRRTVAFVVRILGTMAFTYLLLYVTNLRG